MFGAFRRGFCLFPEIFSDTNASEYFPFGPLRCNASNAPSAGLCPTQPLVPSYFNSLVGAIVSRHRSLFAGRLLFLNAKTWPHGMRASERMESRTDQPFCGRLQHACPPLQLRGAHAAACYHRGCQSLCLNYGMYKSYLPVCFLVMLPVNNTSCCREYCRCCIHCLHAFCLSDSASLQ